MAVSVGTIYATLALRDKLSKPLGAAGLKLGKFGKVAGAGLAVAATAAAAAIAAIGVAAVKTVNAASDFEDSFTGIRKTVDGTEKDFQILAAGMRGLSKEIPISVNELNRIGEAAGQLGVKKEDILGFTRTMADLGATTNLSSDAAATGLARFANVMDNEMGPQFDRLGSTIVALGNNLQTTEAEILNFATRLGASGKIAGLTEADILSIGGALSSVGIKAEAGGTAIQKTLNKMTEAAAQGNEDLAVFAATAGMSAENFATLWKDDAAEGFNRFVEGLGDQGTAAFGTLDALSLSGERTKLALLSVAGAGDLLRDSLVMGTEAWEANTALAKEAELRYNTFSSQIQILKNIFNDVAIAMGQVLLPVLAVFIGNIGDAAAKSSFAIKIVNVFTGALKFMARVLQVLNPIWQALKLAVILIAAPLIAAIKNFYALAEGLAGLYVWIGKGTGSFKVMGIVLDALKSVGSKVVDFFLKIIDSIVEFTSDIPVVGKLVKNTTDSFKTMGSAIKSSVVDTISFNDSMNGMVAGLTESNDVANKGITAQNDLDAAFSQSDEGLKELNETLGQTGEQQEQVVESTEEVKDEFADMVAKLRGDGLVKQIEILQGSYERLTEKGELTAKEQERLVQELIKVRDAGGDIPEAFAGMIDSYEKAEAGAKATAEETARLQGVYDKFSLDGPRQSAADLQKTFDDMGGAANMTEYQLELFGKEAARVGKTGVAGLGADLIGLGVQYGTHTTEKIPSLRTALKGLGDGFEKMATIAGGSFGGVMKKAGETVAKIEIVMATVDTLKATFKTVNDFFAGGGWKSMTDSFNSVVGWFSKMKGGAGGVSTALGATKGVADGLAGSVTNVATQGNKAATSMASSFAGVAGHIAIATTAAIALYKVFQGKSAAERAKEFSDYVHAGGDKALMAERVATAQFAQAQRKAETATGSAEYMGEGAVDETAMEKAARARHRHSQLTRARNEANRLMVKAVEARKAGKSADEIAAIESQRTMLLAVTEMRTRGGAGIEEKIMTWSKGQNFGQFAFAEGGIVTRPTVGLLGEAGAEAVIPLDKLNGMGDEQLLTEMRGLRSELRLLPIQLRDAILLAQ